MTETLTQSTYHAHVVLIALLLGSGCLPGRLAVDEEHTIVQGEHRLDRAYATYQELINNVRGGNIEGNIDLYSCNIPRFFRNDGYEHTQANFLYAMMSNNAYDNPPDKPAFVIPGWDLVRRYTSRNSYEADLYLSADRSEGVLAFKGTDGARDWFTGNISLLPVPPQYVEAQRTLDTVIAEYPNTRFTVTGHSLGGGLALATSLNTEGVNAYVFNTSPRVMAWRGPYENEQHITNEQGEVLYRFSKWPMRWGLPDAYNRRFNFMMAKERDLGIEEHGIYPLARSMLLIAAQGREATEFSQEVPHSELARAAFAANIDRSEALALNPELCGRMFNSN